MLPIKGFTLIEILVAIAIFSIIGMASHRVISSLVYSSAEAKMAITELKEKQRAISLITTDLFQNSSRSTKISPNERAPAIIGNDETLVFTRTGWNNFSSFDRPESQRVKYYFDNSASPSRDSGDLKRQYTYYLDTDFDVFESDSLFRAIKSQSLIEQTLLKDIRLLKFSYIDSENRSHETWLPEQTIKRDVTLKAIRLSIETKNHEFLEKIFFIGRRGDSNNVSG